MKTLTTSTLLIFLISSSAVRSEQRPADRFLQWSLTLDSGGRIESLASLERREQELARQLEPTIRRWHFTPGNVNGQPAETETTLTVRVTLDDTGTSDYRVRIVSARTGARYRTGPVPAYPLSAMRMGRYGQVNVEVAHDADGRVLSARVQRPIDPLVDHALIRATLDAVEKATFQPEIVGGHSVAGTAIASTCFWIEGHHYNPCVWTTPLGDTEQVDTAHPFPTSSVASVSMSEGR